MCLIHIAVNLSLILDYSWPTSFTYLLKSWLTVKKTQNTIMAPDTVGQISTNFRKILYTELILSLSRSVLARDKISKVNFINKKLS